jgi:hypothetical protein
MLHVTKIKALKKSFFTSIPSRSIVLSSGNTFSLACSTSFIVKLDEFDSHECEGKIFSGNYS